MTKEKKQVLRKSQKAHLVVEGDAAATPSPNKKDGQEPNKKHKEDFEQLLDDAVGGVEKKVR